MAPFLFLRCAMPALNNGGNSRCQCADCDEFFNSLGAFDKHRTGSYQPSGLRRCRSIQEMTDSGMCKNAAGFWVTALNEERWNAD